MGRPSSVLRLHRLGHADDHREEEAWRQRLHFSLGGAVHRLHPGLQEDRHHSDAEGGEGQEEDKIE